MWSRAAEGYRVVTVFGLCLWSISTVAQGINENVTAVSASGSVFTAITHNESNVGEKENSSTEPSAGVSGRVGGSLQSGANSLELQYGGSLETTRDLAGGEQSGNSLVVGASRFIHRDPASRFDFNLGHEVNSVRNTSSFSIEPSNYDTRNTLSAGGGIRFYPGDLSTLRFSGQAGRSFGQDDLNDKESFTASTELSRRLSERSTGSLMGSRTWADDDGIDTTIDSAQLIYRSRRENGSFSFGGGLSQAEVDLPGNSALESEAETGFLDRTWVSEEWTTSVQYNRRLSDSAIDLSLNFPEGFEFLPDTIRERDLVVSDSILISHTNFRLCGVCDLGLLAEGAILESEITGATRHEYRANVNFGLQITTLQSLSFAYSWQGDAGENSGTITDQIHRFNTRWTRRLAEDTSFGVELNQTFLRSRFGDDDEQQFSLRLVLTKNFSLVDRRSNSDQ